MLVEDEYMKLVRTVFDYAQPVLILKNKTCFTMDVCFSVVHKTIDNTFTGCVLLYSDELCFELGDEDNDVYWFYNAVMACKHHPMISDVGYVASL